MAQPEFAVRDSPAVVSSQPVATDPAVASWNWHNALPLVWAIGFLVLILRLMAARLMLWSSERRGTLLALSCRQDEGGKATTSSDASIITAFEDAARQLEIFQSVSLLLHSDRTIPVVWGILRHRLLLPVAARQWSSEQLRSVLLHELAHIKRRDTIAQLLGQMACALYWFNPLVWFAAWRLHVERERACDDLVLANGVRASAYAEHLLNVATRLSSSPWTRACGLAMARNSSLEDRLSAVLNDKRNRRSVTSAVVTVALLLGASLAIPVAMVQAVDQMPVEIADAPVPQEGTPNEDVPSTGDAVPPSEDSPKRDDDKTEATSAPAAAEENDAATAASPAAELNPKHADGQTVFRTWQASARTDGKIPGALIGQLGEWVKYFIELNDGAGESGRLTAKFKALLPRFDATHDWTASDAVALIDAVSAIHRIPLSNAIEAAAERVILTGEPLPPELKAAPWGEPAKNGLRVAWLLEPRANEYRLGTSLKSRILVHNSGQEAVFFVMPSWQQSSQHAAHDAKDVAIEVTSTEWTTMARMMVVRLAPGAYCETPAPGIGVGARTGDEDWANIRPGSWILAKEGDEVRFSPGEVEVRMSPFTVGTRHGNGLQNPKDAADLWKKFVAERVARELPIPVGAADREQLLRRLVLDLYGVEPNQGEIDAFVADKSPAALHPILSAQMVETRVMHNRILSPFTGTLPPGEILFRVLAADPEAAKRPRVVTGPGYYNLGDKQRLQVERTRSGDSQKNKATIQFYSNPKPDPHPIGLPDGRLTFAIAWEPGATTLWVTQKGLVRKVDFANPAEVKETRFFEPAELDEVPKPIVDATRAALAETGVQPKVEKPESGAKLDPGREENLQWGQPVNGLRAALIRPPALGLPEGGQSLDFSLVIQNVTKTPIQLIASSLAPNPRGLTVLSREHGWILFRSKVEEPSEAEFLIQPREVVILRMFPPDQRKGTSLSRNLDLIFYADMTIDQAPPGAWTGTLVAAGMHAAFAAHGLLPKHKDAQELFKLWNQGIRWSRTVPGGLIGLLADSVRLYTKNNPNSKSTLQLQKMLPRFDAGRDWDGHEALALLDELATVQAAPIRMLLEDAVETTIRKGTPLPKELANAPWGEAQPNGLRVAWLLDPNSTEHRMGTVLKSRILFHNSGKNTIVLRTRNWYQAALQEAHDSNGADISIITATRSPLRAQLIPFRLRSGEFVEVAGAGVGIGETNIDEKGQGVFVGSRIQAKAGDEVTFTPAKVPANDGEESSALIGEQNWWSGFIAARLDREKPLPVDHEVRRRMFYQVMHDLFGTSPGDEEYKVFLSDRDPTALDSLAARLAERPGLTPFTGSLQSGKTKFRVLAADAAARKPPAGEVSDREFSKCRVLP
ncbi:MAG: DUF1549 domain-containing protein [Planctomycetota bacterium]|nr:DUF1549 domain-containing protein [Planctomycetota bacterium]